MLLRCLCTDKDDNGLPECIEKCDDIMADEVLASYEFEIRERFNDNDKRSDDKGAEPESVEILNIGNERESSSISPDQTIYRAGLRSAITYSSSSRP